MHSAVCFGIAPFCWCLLTFAFVLVLVCLCSFYVYALAPSTSDMFSMESLLEGFMDFVGAAWSLWQYRQKSPTSWNLDVG